MISEIEEKLKEIDENVQYGVCKKKNNSWNCLVLRKEKMKKSGTSKQDYSTYISVRIVREDEIEEGMEQKVITKMREAGWRLSEDDIQYEYTVDTNEIVVEVCKMEFVKAEKGCKK